MSKLSILLLLLCITCGLCAVACGSGREGPVQAAETPEFGLITEALAPATAGLEYTQEIELTRPGRVSIISGALPFGLELTGGAISGTPRITGDWRVTVQATDGSTWLRREFTLHVAGVDGDAEVESRARTLQMFERILGLLPEDRPRVDPARVELGRLLFFEKELSGTRDVACATCHHPAFGFGDGLNFSVGVGATGLGPQRRHPEGVLVPRNSPSIYNTGLMPSLFWDRRVRQPGTDMAVAVSTRAPVITPDGRMDLEPVEAQALFPMADVIEMRGTGHELEGLSDRDYRAGIVERLNRYPEYIRMFEEAFGPEGMTVENMVRAIGDFERSQTYVNSPFDRYLLGDSRALTDAQKRGLVLFFDRANCDNCHNGPLLSNFVPRNIIVPQFGPGKGKGASKGEDYGAEDVANDRRQRYAFRTPSLRNVALTAPYMHNGAFNTLREVVLHYRDKGASTRRFSTEGLTQADLLGDPVEPTAAFIRSQSFILRFTPDDLTDQEVDDLVSFLEALTDPEAVNRMDLVPEQVPSGLPVDR
jgi:cytochrome c peroxidase